jgi:hypothetical protein
MEIVAAVLALVGAWGEWRRERARIAGRAR